ncbi:MAG: EpsG family protein [Clostridia bacterium]|nr:EpsG family protein [Clostridia bacterium]
MIFNFCLVMVIIALYAIIYSTKRISKNIKSNLFLILSFSIIAILMSMRTYSTGTDTNMYVHAFEKFSQYKWSSTIFGGYYEPLYVITNIIISYISYNPRILIICTSLFICYAFYRFIKDNSNNYLLSVLMFICLLFFYSAMNTIRQYLAISIILLGFDFVKRKRFIPYVITIVIAVLFHTSAFVGILIYPLYNMKYSKLRVIGIFVVAILVNIFISDVVNQVYDLFNRTNYYSNRIGQENISNLIHIFVFLSMYIFSILLVKKSQNKNEKNDFYFYIFVVAAACSLIAMKMNVLSRISAYFSIFTIICLPNIITDNLKTEKNKLIIYYSISIILLIYSSIIIYFRPEWNSAFRYKSCIVDDDNTTYIYDNF